MPNEMDKAYVDSVFLTLQLNTIERSIREIQYAKEKARWPTDFHGQSPNDVVVHRIVLTDGTAVRKP
jgi:hypothetical protein